MVQYYCLNSAWRFSQHLAVNLSNNEASFELLCSDERRVQHVSRTANMRTSTHIQGHESWEIHWSATMVGEFLRISMPYLTGWPQCLRILKLNFKHLQTILNWLNFERSKTRTVQLFRLKRLQVLGAAGMLIHSWDSQKRPRWSPLQSFGISRQCSFQPFSSLFIRYRSTMQFLALLTQDTQAKASRSMLSCVGALETQVCKWKSIGPTDSMVPISAKHCKTGKTLKIFIGTRWDKVNHGQPQQQKQ